MAFEDFVRLLSIAVLLSLLSLLFYHNDEDDNETVVVVVVVLTVSLVAERHVNGFDRRSVVRRRGDGGYRQAPAAAVSGSAGPGNSGPSPPRRR